jgi:nitroreductase
MKYDLSEISDVIQDRRTIHPENFSDRVVQPDMVRQILTNAIWAPTHKKTQPWRFKVYSGDGREVLLSKLKEMYHGYLGEEASPAKWTKMETRVRSTSVIIAMVMVRTEDVRLPEIEEVEAVSCAAQNMMLTATAYGLGSFWSSPTFLYHDNAAVDFGYKSKDKILGLMYLGYPKGDWPKSHRKPLEYVTEWVNGE